MKKRMTIEEFRTGLDEMLIDAANPHGELAFIMEEANDFIADAAQFDPIFASKLQVTLNHFTDLVTYVKARKEQI